jgi:FkbM family methyltransferase
MQHHHQVFKHFSTYRGTVPPGYGIDFLGTKISSKFVKGLYTPPEGVEVTTAYPESDEEYFEWIDLLESVVAARDSCTMIDLGAGYGRWAIRAAYALRQSKPHLPDHLIAVEAGPAVFQWMCQHFRNNGIYPMSYTLIHGAVGETPGEVLFYIGGPRGGPYDRNPNDWYGQFLTKDYDVSGEFEDGGEYCGFKVRRHKSEWRSISVPGVSLASLLRDVPTVDLIDMDIEGQELPSVRSNIDQLDQKVKRLHIGMHGKEIEDELRQLLTTRGWDCLADTVFSSSETPWGTLSFENGVQSWVNPRLK